jgi:hypothetical protein
MKSTFKIQNAVLQLNEDVAAIAEIEKDIRFSLKTYYKNRVEGTRYFRLKTFLTDGKLYLTIYFFLKHKRQIKPVTIVYSSTIVEDAIADIDKKLAAL